MTSRPTPADLEALIKLAEAATPIAEAPGYRVHSDGFVLSTGSNWRGHVVRIIAAQADSDGYLRVRMSVAGRRRAESVHRLVARAYLPPRPSPAHEVRHLDGDRRNNRSTNLAWGTRAENAADREHHGRTARGARNGGYCATTSDRQARGERIGNSRMTAEAVSEARRRSESGESVASIARDFGLPHRTVYGAIMRETWRHVP